MSQTQPTEVVTNVLSMRGIDSDILPSLPSDINRTPRREIGDSGLREFAQTWKKVKDRRSLDFCWTDKVEYQIINLDHVQKQAVLCPGQSVILRRIQTVNGRMWGWKPGVTKFTIEAATSTPYSPQLDDLLLVEQNFRQRRKYLRSFLNHDQAPFTLNILPELDVEKQLQDEVIRSKTEEQRQRPTPLQRSFSDHGGFQSSDSLGPGHKSAPSSPTFKSVHLQRPRLHSTANETTIPQKIQPNTYVPELGARGLQVTFGCHDLREARYLHDQMCVLNPIMLSFTASTPVSRGRLSNYDVRLRATAKSSNECKPGEKCSLARPWRTLYPTYLGLDAPRSRITRSNTSRDVFHSLQAEGLDDAMASFCAQGFTCAPPHTMNNSAGVTQSNEATSATFFERATSSLNPHVQLKLPDLNNQRVGFRVEFGAMEIQLTDFANAACIFFVALLRFAILGFDLDFRLPPHMVAENIAKAHKEDSIRNEKFWWRSVRWRVNGFAFHNNEQPLTTDAEPTLVSIDHIINGDPSRPETVGLSGVLDAYLADVEDASDAGSCAEATASVMNNDNHVATISRYLAFIRRRAKGTIWTDARVIRHFVKAHPEYDEGDETLSSGIWYDLIRNIELLNDGTVI